MVHNEREGSGTTKAMSSNKHKSGFSSAMDQESMFDKDHPVQSSRQESSRHDETTQRFGETFGGDSFDDRDDSS